MRRLFFLACFASLLDFAHAQGLLIFANSNATAITNGLTGLRAPGGPEQDDTYVGLYAGNVGDPVPSLQLVAVTNCFSPGRFSKGTLALAGWPGGAVVQLQVRVWLASIIYATYEAALAAALGGDTSVLLGASVPMFAQLQGAGNPPLPVSMDAYGLNPVVLMPIPEPSEWALVAVAMGAAVLAGRRKRNLPLRP